MFDDGGMGTFLLCLASQDAAAALARFELLVLVGLRRPVANFGYEGGPSELIKLQVNGRWAAFWLGWCWRAAAFEWLLHRKLRREAAAS